MNQVQLIGRMTRDPEIKTTQNGNKIARFTLAVERRFNREQQTADFISCVAFSRSAEFFEKYCNQGTKVGITGRIQTGSYTNNAGQKVYTTDVIVESQEFTEGKKKQEEVRQEPPAGPAPDFMDIPEESLDELPFH